ncbi:hypothetical protein BH24BAC1_BH24BAC1_41010 [soil metagenome]
MHAQGYTRAHFLLDNNTTHKARMQSLFQHKSGHLPLEASFPYFPKYSPKLNVVEYLIHLIRLKWLHHADFGQRLEAVEKKLVDRLHQRVFLPAAKIANILQHIQELILKN